MKPICMVVRLGGETFRIGVDGDRRLAAMFRKVFPGRDGPGAADLTLLWRDGEGSVRCGRSVRRSGDRRELAQWAEWMLTSAAFRRIRRERLLLHGACVARGRAAALLAGRHGNGKTTLAVALALRRGWQMLGDDVVTADEEGRVRAIERPVRLKPGIERVLPELRRVAIDRGAWRKDWPALVPLSAFGMGASRVKARCIVLLGRAGGRLRVTAVREGEAVAALAKVAWNFRDDPARSLRTLGAIASGARAHRLVGGSLEERCAAVESLAGGRCV